MRYAASLIALGALMGVVEPAAAPVTRAVAAPVEPPAWPEKTGRPYAVAGVTYTPADTAGYAETGYASWYGDELKGKPTANGEPFDPEALTAAHRTLPMPSFLEVTALDTGRTLVVRVNDRGPFANDRLLDLSQGAARELGVSGDGHVRIGLRRLALDREQIAAFRADERYRAERRAAAIRPAAMPATTPGGGWHVQLATFASPTRAASLTERSGATSSPAGALHRVRFGPFADARTATQALQAARSRGYPEARLFQD